MAFFGLGGGGLTNKGASREMPSMDRDRGDRWRNRQQPQAPATPDQGFYQPVDQAGKAALLQAMIARSRAGYGA